MAAGGSRRPANEKTLELPTITRTYSHGDAKTATCCSAPSLSELLYADYRVCYAMPDGHIPAKGGTYLIASNDNGDSFKHRATISVDREGDDPYREPAMEETS